MSAFFGIISLKEPVNSESVEDLALAMRKPVFNEPRLQKDATGKVVFGHLSLLKNPLFVPVVNEEKNIFLTGHFRLDYKDELRQKLGIAARNASDAQMALLAYQKWGTECVRHLEGDWAMAVHDFKKGKTFFAKDAFVGISALYYTIRKEVIYFTSDLESLKAVKSLPLSLDKTELARSSFRLFGPTPGRTLLENVYQLVSGQFIEISTNGQLQQFQYCSVRNVTPIRYKDRDQYFGHFKELFSRAVQTRLDPTSENGIILSGGLDSSGVASFAADWLAKDDRTLHSFTSIPAYLDQIPPADQFRSNERPLVEALLESKKNIRAQFEDSKNIYVSSSLLDDDVLNLNTVLATPNSFWLDNILRKASDQKINRLLTGQLGNPIISWRGSFSYIDLFYNMRWISLTQTLYEEKKWQQASWPTLIKKHILAPLRRDLIALKNRSRSLEKHPSVTSSILHKNILKRLDWDEIAQQLVYLIKYTSLQPYHSIRRNLVSKWNAYGGTRWYTLGMAKGIIIADPTADWRLASFSFGVPEELWQQEGISKYLYKKSIGLNVPSAISQNPTTMQQSADLSIRITKDIGFESLVLEIAHDPSLYQLIDHAKLLNTWQLFKTEQNLVKKNGLGAILIGNLSTCLLLRNNLSLYDQII